MRTDVKVAEKSKKKLQLSDVKEDDESDGAEDDTSQLLSLPSAVAGVRGRSPASTPTGSPSVPPLPPRSRSPSPLPPAASAVRSPSPLPALSTTAQPLPLPDLSGVYILDKERSQSLAPLLTRYGIRVPKAGLSAAARLRQCKSGMKPSPIPLLPASLLEIVRLSCYRSTITAAYYVCKQWVGLSLSSYPSSCFVLVATERFTADGNRRMTQSELHPPIEARCVVKVGAVVTVEAEGGVGRTSRLAGEQRAETHD